MGADTGDPVQDPTSGPPPSWGSAGGFLTFRSGGNPDDRHALDAHLIQERIARYGWSFDERRADQLAQCFTEDALWWGNIAGTAPVEPVRGRDSIVTWLSDFWPRQSDQRRHLMTSVLIQDQSPSHASAICSLLLTSAQAATLSVVLTSFYRFALVKSSGVWQINELFEGCDVPF